MEVIPASSVDVVMLDVLLVDVLLADVLDADFVSTVDAGEAWSGDAVLVVFEELVKVIGDAEADWHWADDPTQLLDAVDIAVLLPYKVLDYTHLIQFVS